MKTFHLILSGEKTKRLGNPPLPPPRNAKLITLKMASQVQIHTWHESLECLHRLAAQRCCGKMRTPCLHPACKSQLLILGSILFDSSELEPSQKLECTCRISKGATHFTNGEKPAEAAPGTGWLPANTHSASPRSGRPEQGPPKGTDNYCIGGGGAYESGPIFKRVVSGLSSGTASCFIKSQLLAKKAVCLLCGQGPNRAAGNSKPALRADIKPGKNMTAF